MLILQPPLRTSFYSSALIVQKRPHYQAKENYVVIPNDGIRRAFYLVNKDKASNYKIYKQRQDELNYIDIENKELINLLYYSYENTRVSIYLKKINNQLMMLLS